MASPIAPATEAVEEGFTGFDPENVADMRKFFADMPEFFRTLASSVNTLADKFGDDLPLDPQLADHVREMVGVIAGLGDHSEELASMFEKVHEPELNRVDSPRPGEEKFDVSQQ